MSLPASTSKDFGTTLNDVSGKVLEMASTSSHDPWKTTDTGGDTYGCASALDYAVDQDMVSDMPESSDRIPTGRGRAFYAERSRSFLLLICCSYNKVVPIQFRQHTLPKLTELDQKAIRAGLAYATCITCQLERVQETKKESKQFDFARSEEFRSDMIQTDDQLQRKVMAVFQRALALHTKILQHDSNVVYLFLRVVQRAMGAGDLVHMVQFTAHQEANELANIRFLVHTDGDFFKTSMRPASAGTS